MRSSFLAALVLALVVAAPGGPVANEAEDCDGSYTVRDGDTLSVIATRCASTVEALLGANPDLADPGRISIGQELAVPDGDGAPAGEQAGAGDASAAPAAEPEPEPELYTVQAGDSLASIAAGLGISLSELRAMNEGVDPRALQLGQELRLPAGAGGAEEGSAEQGAGDGGEQAAAAPDGEDAPATESLQSEPVPSEPERLMLEGRIRKGAECPVLRTPDGQIYGLVSQSYGFTPGDYVAIEGEPVAMSFCMEGQTVRVTSMRAQSAPKDR